MNIVRKHPYIITTITSIFLAVVVWMLVPKHYTAQTTLSDEYKETDLVVGLNNINVFIRNATGAEDLGVNNVEVYAKILKSYDFDQKIANIKIPGKGIKYADYLNEEDTLKEIRDRISYNVRTKKSTLTIAFTDRDPLVASQMLDSITAFLQSEITTARRKMSAAAFKNSLEERKSAGIAYKEAQAKYASYVDTHFDTELDEEKSEERALQNELSECYKHYSAAAEKCARYDMLLKRSYFSFAVLKVNQVPEESLPYLIGYILIFVFFSLLAVKGYHLYKDRRLRPTTMDLGGASSPWCITIVVWATLMFAMMFRDPTILMSPSSQFYISLALWLLFFTLTSVVTYNLLPTNSTDKSKLAEQASAPIKFSNINKFVFYFLFLVSIVITPLFLKKIMDTVMMFGTNDLLNNMRTLAIFGNEQGFLNYAIVINEVLMIVALFAYPNIKKWVLIVSCLSSLVNSIAIMEKGGILLVAFCIIFILYQRGHIKLRTIAIIGVIIVFLSYGFNLIRESGESLSAKSNEYSLFDFIGMYLLSPPVAYCQITQELSPQFGAHSFPLVYFFLNKFCGGNYEFFDRLQDFVFVPVSTNVYTIFQPFYMDFGQFGIAVFAIIYGVMTGWVYRLMRNGNPFGKCFYMYIGYVLVLQFFQEYIFTGNLHIIQLIVFIFMCTQDKFEISIIKTSIKKK